MSQKTKGTTVPIGGDPLGSYDPFYRYQMPVVECEIKRRNKTAIKNMVEVARALNRSPEEVVKYLGHSLNSTGSYSSKTQEYQVNGSHSEQAIQDKLQDYCKSFVVCGMCNNPETEYKIRQENIWLVCHACGGRTKVEGTLKLCKHILTQHKLSSQAYRKKRTRARSTTVQPTIKTDIHEEKARSRKDKKVKKQVGQPDASAPRLGDYDEKFENPYFSTKGNPLFVGSFDLIASKTNCDECTAMEQAVARVQAFLVSNPDAPAADILNTVTKAQQQALVLFSHDRIRVFIKAALSPGSKPPLSKEHVHVLSHLVEESSGQDRTEEYLIAAVEEACEDEPNSFPFVFLMLYEEDIIEEEHILSWASGQVNRAMYVSKEALSALQVAAAPLISWLKKEEELLLTKEKECM